MQEVEKYIADGRVLALLEKYLQQNILDGLRDGDRKRERPRGGHQSFVG